MERMKLGRASACVLAALAAGLLPAMAAQAQVTIETIVQSTSTQRDPVPNRPAPYVFRGESNTQLPVINDDGVVVFRARSASEFNTNTGQAWGIYVKRPGEPLAVLVDTLVDDAGTPGFAVPGRAATAAFIDFKAPLLNNAGDVVFQGRTYDADGGTRAGLYATHITGGPIVKIVDDYDNVPGIGTPFVSFNNPATNQDLTLAALNEPGQVVFWASFAGSSGGGLFGSTVAGAPVVALAHRAITPTDVPFGTPQPFSEIRPNFALSNTGLVAFNGTIRLNSSSGPLRSGNYRVPADGSALPECMTFAFAPTPYGDGTTFSVMSDQDIDDSGRIIFFASLSDSRTGIYSVTTPGGPYTVIVDNRVGGANVPGEAPAAEFDALWTAPITESGRLGFYSRIRNAATPQNSGIYLADAASGDIDLVQDRTPPAPGHLPPAYLNDFEGSLGAAINEASNLLFSANGVDELGAGIRGLYFYDRCSQQVLRIVDSSVAPVVLGDTFSTSGAQTKKLLAYQSVFAFSGRFNALTEDNRVAFLAQFSNSNFGIYVATVTAGGGGGEATITCPADVAEECPADTSPAVLGEATAVDGCTGASIPTTYADVTTTGCGQTEVVTRVWTADGGAGSSVSCTQIIAIDDTTAPELVGVPADAVAECGEVPAAAEVTATDACDVAPVVVLAETTTPGECPGDYTLARTWTATDACGNSVSAEQQISVADTAAPQVVCPADQAELACASDTSPAATGEATASDDCGTAAVAYADVTSNGCGNTTAIDRTWTATDACGNAADCVQHIVTSDAIAPTIVCPADQTALACGADTSVAATGSATGSDDCGAVTIAHSDASVPGCGGESITRTWTATDACGNVAECVQAIASVDSAAPTITCPADQLDLPCGSDTSVAATGMATADDDCGAPTVSHSDAVSAGCGASATITRTWTAVDACGNTASCVQTVSTVDAEGPAITCPADQTELACGSDLSPATTGSASASDGCGAAMVAYSDAVEPGCGDTVTVARTWTATDACGNATQCTQQLATVDTTAPELNVSGAPIVVTDVNCSGGEPVTLPAGSATDECGDVTVTHDGPATFPAGETIPVTFSAEDDCGNTASESVDVTVKYGSTIAIDARQFVLGLGHHPTLTEQPLDNIEVCAYERSCALARCGILYLLRFPCVMAQCAPVACATTDANGQAELNVPPGKYVVISDDATQLILPTPLGAPVDNLSCGETELVRLRQIQIATGRRIACRVTRLTGSELLILEPEEVLWDDTEQLYPFVFESVGEWDVTVGVTPPDGFVADYDQLSDEVNNDNRAVQFTITEVGSDLVPTQTRFDVFHKGKLRVVESKIRIALTARYARSRGFDVRALNAQGLIKELPKAETEALHNRLEP